MTLKEPSPSLADPGELFVAYLDYYRAEVLRKLDGMAEEELRSSWLPSGWTPLELVKHLAYMEQRWLRWGFAGEAVPSPWGDWDAGRERWEVSPQDTLASLTALLREQGERTREIVAGAALLDRAPAGPRCDPAEEPPALSWILFHVLQEYARHAGHLDIVCELVE